MRRLSLFFDVEDPYGEYSDDAALDVVKVFEKVGVPGTFCITGAKCRVLAERKRWDIIGALGRHSLGLHTNPHSIHPTTMELLEDKGWEDGCAAILESETPGVRAFETIFGRKPSCWAGAGFTWGPQVAGSLEELGIPSYAYAMTEVPGRRVHEFSGRLAFPLTGVVTDTVYEWKLGSTPAILLHIARKAAQTDSTWLGVLMGHPSRLRYTDYFDAPFHAGVNPDPYPVIPAKSKVDYARVLRNLEASLRALNSRYEIVGFDTALRQNWNLRPLSSGELEIAKESTVANIRKRAAWPTHKLMLKTDKIEAETLTKINTLRMAT